MARKRRCSCDGGKLSWKLIRTIGRAGGCVVCWHALNPRMCFSLSGLTEAGPAEPPLCQIPQRGQASRARHSSHLQPSERFLSAAHKPEQKLQIGQGGSPPRSARGNRSFRADSRVETRAAITVKTPPPWGGGGTLQVGGFLSLVRPLVFPWCWDQCSRAAFMPAVLHILHSPSAQK